jgi:serine/threonine-protein kinase
MMRIGEFAVEQELGGDATVILYRALHQVLPRRALIKVARTPQDSLAVLREACILAALQHPGVIRVYETGRLDGLDEPRAWVAYELVDGLTLADTFELGEIEASVMTPMLRDVAEILSHAHQRGIIHRGISPERLVVIGQGRGFPMCVTDWSSARAHDAPPAPMEGISPYMAPELARGETADDRADVFALGVIAYRALTGALPFTTLATDAEGAVQHPPTELKCPDAPRELTGLVDQMLAVDRWDRPSSGEVRTELGWLADQLAETRQPPQPKMVRIRRPRWTPAYAPASPRPDTEVDVDLDDLDLPERS